MAEGRKGHGGDRLTKHKGCIELGGCLVVLIGLPLGSGHQPPTVVREFLVAKVVRVGGCWWPQLSGGDWWPQLSWGGWWPQLSGGGWWPQLSGGGWWTQLSGGGCWPQWSGGGNQT